MALTAQDSPPTDRLLKPAVVADRLGIDDRTLFLWRQSGDGPPFYRLAARTIRYNEAEVDAWIEGRSGS